MLFFSHFKIISKTEQCVYRKTVDFRTLLCYHYIYTSIFIVAYI